jgi:hypothetical protein
VKHELGNNLPTAAKIVSLKKSDLGIVKVIQMF